MNGGKFSVVPILFIVGKSDSDSSGYWLIENEIRNGKKKIFIDFLENLKFCRYKFSILFNYKFGTDDSSVFVFIVNSIINIVLELFKLPNNV